MTSVVRGTFTRRFGQLSPSLEDSPAIEKLGLNSKQEMISLGAIPDWYKFRRTDDYNNMPVAALASV